MLMCKYVIQKKNSSVWYYRRRIPNDVAKLHINPKTGKVETQIFLSLKTTDKALACKRADEKTRSLNALWAAHRKQSDDYADPRISLERLKAAGFKPGDGRIHVDSEGIALPPLDDFIGSIRGVIEQFDEPEELSPQDEMTLDILFGAPIPKTLLDAKELYISLGKGPKNKVAQGQFDRAWDLLWEITGNKVLGDVRRADANEFVSRLIARGVSADTIRKYIAQINPAIKLAIKEFELDVRNQFEGLVLTNADNEPRHERFPYSEAELKAIKLACRAKDDPRRWLVAALSDTGARLSELLGLERADVFLDSPVPYVHIRPNQTRGLKTDESDRTVPLVGDALWAFQRALEGVSEHVFPTLLPEKLGTEFNSGSVSAALGKWLKDNKLAGKGQALHSFRHTMADRLRNAGVSKELLEAIGGWKTDGMSSRYGGGFSLEVKRQALYSIA